MSGIPHRLVTSAILLNIPVAGWCEFGRSEIAEKLDLGLLAFFAIELTVLGGSRRERARVGSFFDPRCCHHPARAHPARLRSCCENRASGTSRAPCSAPEARHDREKRKAGACVMWSFDDGDGIVYVYEPGELPEPTETLQQEVARLCAILRPPSRDRRITQLLRAILGHG